MAALTNLIPLALEGQWRGWAAAGLVMTMILFLVGSIYVLLWGVYGAKVGYLVLGTSLFGFLIILSMIWVFGAPGTVPGVGPRGTEPHWIPFLAESEQGRELREAIQAFPAGWDEIGQSYPGGIDSGGELEKVSDTVRVALARLAAFQGLPADEPDDWDFSVAGGEAAADEEGLPQAVVRFYQRGTPLVFGARIPATDTHREVAVFALRDKGKVFLPGAIFLGVSVIMFVAHIGGLWWIERREQGAEQEQARTPEPAGV